ncbi:Aspartate aminotransferase, cytoplasmic [Pichia californica]|nr:Aspartate aminotransferase, cytoplasmic [[Candida] californica]
MSRGFYSANIQQLPPDPMFGLKARYVKDTRENKVDLGIGAYRDDNGKPWILPSVKLAENLILNSKDYNHEYLPINGLPEFTSSAAKVILGNDSKAITEDRLISTQTLSGTGALHVAGLFIREYFKSNDQSDNTLPLIYMSNPTWANHFQLFELLGFKTATYPYWNSNSKSLDLDGFLNSIKNAPKGSVFVLHATAHNPTGLDPTTDQWKQILNLISENNHLPLFDSAYQGFSSGSLEKDAWAVREGVNNNNYKFPGILICQSFAKNVGMYGERIGAVHVVLNEHNSILNNAVKSHLAKIIRSEISNPPGYGAKIVAKILNTPEIYLQWEKDLITMSSRINRMRQELVSELQRLQTPGTWNHITEQQGMFSFTGLNPEQVSKLENDHGIYLLGSGRASVAGLNPSNVKYVAQSIDKVVRETA